MSDYPATQALIELSGVRKIYRLGNQEVRALDGINLQIHSGDYAAIIGPSGSGKSTLMHLLGCLDTPTEGTVVIDGLDASRAGATRLARIRNEKIGFVFQTFNLLPKLNVEENVALPLVYAGVGATERRRKVRAALEAVGLADRIGHRPNELSGGQNQRVAIARALVNDPKLLLADEPTGALDSQTGEQVMQLFRELNARGNTVLLVTHDPDIARETNRRIHIRDGRIHDDESSTSSTGGGGSA
ncbi:MAG: ABC transporter ATP-binding protein [Candidatus Methylacidiphilales bacterium]|nr:ABC transporter ATP-binding protein [Candidatus Methylacidiphilales bacterium]